MSMKSRIPKLILIIVVIVLLLVLILQNLNPATINILFWKIENLPIIAVVLITLVLGYSLGLLTYTFIFRKKDKQEALEKKIKANQKNKG